MSRSQDAVRKEQIATDAVTRVMSEMNEDTMCDEFRREALAYIVEHFDGGNDQYDHEAMWKRTSAHVLGPVPTTKVDPECSHDKLLRWHPQKEVDRCVESLCAVMELHIEMRRGDRWAAIAFDGQVKDVKAAGVSPADYDALDLLTQQQLDYWAVATWLVNVRDGIMDATHAFLDDEENADT